MQAADESVRTIKIALTGAHGTGKTTVINALEARCAERNISVEVVREIPRLICESVDDPTFFRQQSNTFAKQSLLLQGQIQAELRAITSSPELILCDRALLDHWIYTTHFHRSALDRPNVIEAYASMVVQHCSTYDMIFYIPVEFSPVDDGVREADLEFQEAIDRGIRAFLQTHRLKFVAIRGTVEERSATVLDFIDAQLSATHRQVDSTDAYNKWRSDGTKIGATEHVIDADSAYRKVLADVLATDQEIIGGQTKSVGSKRRSKEMLHYSVVIHNPRERLIWNPKRKINLPAAVARFVWMMAGNDRLQDIAFYEKKVANFSDDGIVVSGSNYGHRMIYPAPGCDQIQGVINRLKDDPATRRAAISVYRAEDATRISADIPCTFGLAFHNRGEFLHPSVVMRSNNAFILLPYNIFEFSLLGEAVAAEVGLKLGAMSYHAMSMHVYSNDYDSAQEVIDSELPSRTAPVPVMPKSPSPMAQIRELVKIEAEARHAAAGFSPHNFETQWLPFADARLDPYWRQFYYLLLFAMCGHIEFAQGMSRLREFIDEPWLSCLPPKTIIPQPVKRASPDTDLFHQLASETLRSDRLDEGILPTSVRRDSTALSRADLEQELEQVLSQYQPYVARDQWSRVRDYRSVFLKKATESPDKLRRVFERLQRLKFSLGKGEKVETHRARADLIIDGLEKLTTD
jgi:thymidylate synthase